MFAAKTQRGFLGLDLGICVSSYAPVRSAPRRVFGRCLLIARTALCSQCRSVCWHIPAKPQRGGGQDDFWEVAQRGRCLYGFTEVYQKPCVELPLFLPRFFPVFFPPPMYPSSLCYTWTLAKLTAIGSRRPAVMAACAGCATGKLQKKKILRVLCLQLHQTSLPKCMDRVFIRRKSPAQILGRLVNLHIADLTSICYSTEDL